MRREVVYVWEYGDRVRLIGSVAENGVPLGTHGTVRDLDPSDESYPVLVYWDGHEGYSWPAASDVAYVGEIR